jgi:calcium-dependent protein kinase
LSKDEILVAYKKIKGADFSEQDVIEMIKKADVDGNGQISYNEWLLTAVSVEKLLQEDKLESAFKLFDKDNSRTLTI